MGLHSAERNSLCVKTRERLSCLSTTGVDSDTAGVSPDSLHSFLPCFIKNRYKGSLFGSEAKLVCVMFHLVRTIVEVSGFFQWLTTITIWFRAWQV